MANAEHLKILEKGVQFWNAWRDINPRIIPDLSFAHLKSMLPKTTLLGINLREVNLSYTSFGHGNFDNIHLDRANLSHANLSESHFINSKFTEADLNSMNVTLSSFLSCNFQKSEMTKVILGNTIFTDCNFESAKNLETCKHWHWSAIDYLTLAQSGKLPLSFLRGCGLPDFIIDNINVLQNDPIIFYSCFISYSSKDEEFANRLYADLQNKGIRCWYAPENMKGGKKSYDQINEAIRMHDKLLLVLSEDSMRSDWVVTEIKKARAGEKYEKRQMLFPIGIVPYDEIKKWELFDSDTGNDLASEVRSYHIPDFSDWKSHDSYRKGFERLVKDLKGEKSLMHK